MTRWRRSEPEIVWYVHFKNVIDLVPSLNEIHAELCPIWPYSSINDFRCQCASLRAVHSNRFDSWQSTESLGSKSMSQYIARDLVHFNVHGTKNNICYHRWNAVLFSMVYMYTSCPWSDRFYNSRDWLLLMTPDPAKPKGRITGLVYQWLLLRPSYKSLDHHRVVLKFPQKP